MTADDAIDALSTGALLCSEACGAPKDPSIEETRDEIMEVEAQDEAKADEKDRRMPELPICTPMRGTSWASALANK